MNFESTKEIGQNAKQNKLIDIMKTNSNPLTKLVRAATLAVSALALLTTSSHASRIEMTVKAYGRQWALIVPGSNTGGRVVWNAARGRYITDRGARNEPLSVCFFASQPGEVAGSWGMYSSCNENDGVYPPLPFCRETYVPGPANCVNVHYWLFTNYGYNDVELPIGSRP